MNEFKLDLSSILDGLRQAVKVAGEICRDAWNKPSHIRHKGRTDLVTETDMAVQAALAESLRRLLPEAVFLGEENAGNGETPEGLVWIVDPVDGTTNFAHRLPIFAISAALCAKRRPLVGVVYAPMLDESFWAAKGGGTFFNGERVSVSSAANLADALVATGFPYEPAPTLDNILGALREVLPATQGLRRLGAASLDLAYVACGRMDVFYETGLKPWDMAAGWLLVEEAGGKVTRQDGSPIYPGDPLLATNGLLHADMTNLLSRV